MNDNAFENCHEDELKKNVLLEAEMHLENREYLDAIKNFSHLALIGKEFEGYFGLFRTYSTIFFIQDDDLNFIEAGELALMFGDYALEYDCHPQLYDELATIYFLAAETQAAVEMIERGLEKFPENFRIIRDAANYISCLDGQSNKTRAISLLDKAKKLVFEHKEDFKRADRLIRDLKYEKRKLEEKLKNTQPELEF